MSASRASPGPLTTHPITATCSGDLAVAERLHRPVGDVDHVDLGAPARRAGDQVDVLAFPQTQRLEQLAAGASLFHRVGGERVADRVADAFHQQGGDAGGGLHQTSRRRAGFGDAEVERMSVTSASWRYASTINGTLDALTEIFIRSKPTSSK